MKKNSKYFEVAPGIWGQKIIFVNIYMIAQGDRWVLIDTGLPGCADRIIAMAEELFGDTPPAAILMTHGHFDHRGAVEDLVEKWAVPVYAHHMELPYLQGKSAYPPADPTVGGGLMSLMSVLYPKRPIDLGESLIELPADGSVPYLSDWQALYTPGHSPGHVSFFRTSDRVLIAGDAFVTTQQESALATITSFEKVCGPPRYFTPDWVAAEASVKKLRDLNPAIAATGHGKPMHGTALTEGLNQLADHFKELAKPANGRYVPEPARADEDGVQYVPPSKLNIPVFAGMLLTGVVAFIVLRKIVS